uniref:Uncharacterized protein n=1 Tax=Arundo donax TaxID=35708 RepID=A0A0A9E975_ARUDO
MRITLRYLSSNVCPKLVSAGKRGPTHVIMFRISCRNLTWNNLTVFII